MRKLILATLITLNFFVTVSHAEDVDIQLKIATVRDKLQELEVLNTTLKQELANHEDKIANKRRMLQELESKIDAMKTDEQ